MYLFKCKRYKTAKPSDPPILSDKGGNLFLKKGRLGV